MEKKKFDGNQQFVEDSGLKFVESTYADPNRIEKADEYIREQKRKILEILQNEEKIETNFLQSMAEESGVSLKGMSMLPKENLTIRLGEFEVKHCIQIIENIREVQKEWKKSDVKDGGDSIL